MKLFIFVIGLLVLSTSLFSVFAIPSKDISLNSFVIDQAKVLSPNNISELNSLLSQIKTSGKAEFVVLIVDNLNNEAIESYSLNVVQNNLGNENNNGLLLLVSIEDRKYRFETGRGIEVELPDVLLGRIGRDILVPNFKQNNYGSGIILAVKNIDGILEGKEYVSPKPSKRINFDLIFWGVIMIFWFIVPLIKRNKPPKKGSSKNRNHSNSDLFAAAFIGSMIGGRGGGNFGGGGFGGGGFGGGGAGGGW